VCGVLSPHPHAHRYGHCVGIAGCVMCWVALIKLHLADSANVRWNAVRFVLAAAHINYYSLSGGALTIEEWAVVQVCG